MAATLYSKAGHATCRRFDMTDSLDRYRQKRDFTVTAEPSGEEAASADSTKKAAGSGKDGKKDRSTPLSFVVQKHAASHLHYDFRLEWGGTLKSWAVPKGPSLDPADKRMAVHVEDHPIAYASFEGTIAEKQYGAGTVIVWDRGEWLPDGDAGAGYADGKLKFELRGEKLQGHWTLVRMKPRAGERQEAWLLIKERDAQARSSGEYSVTEALQDSVIEPGSEFARGMMSGASDVASVSVRTSATRKPRAKTAAATVKTTTESMHSPSSSPKRTARAGAVADKAKITHPERVIDASTGITKLELAEYYLRAAPAMLPHLASRPVSLVRGPDGIEGELFFQKHADKRTMPNVHQLDQAFDPEHAPLLEIDSEAGLLGAVQMNVIEFHTWNATTKAIDTPDRMVFDLDPGEGVEFQAVREGAELTAALLTELGLKSFLKTSGGKGLHLVVPLTPKWDWDTVKDLSQAVVQHISDTLPDRFVVKSGPKNRVGKIFVDYLRNGRGSTTASAFSARARPGMGVSVPVGWDELSGLTGGDHWTVRTVSDRLGRDTLPWADYRKTRQSLAKAMKLLGFKPSPSK